MNPSPSLDDLLPAALDHLADELEQPLAPDARQAIRRRTEALRRRRRAQRAVAMGAVAAGTVAAGMWLRVGDGEVRTAPPATAPKPTGPHFELPADLADPPAITIRSNLVEEVYRTEEASSEPPADRTTQFFDQPDHVKRPTVKVIYGKAASIAARFDTHGPIDDVDVNGVQAQIQVGEVHTLMTWHPTADTTMLVDARRLGRDDLLDFARGLRPRAVGEGVEARVLPAELYERGNGIDDHREQLLLSPPDLPAVEARIVFRPGGQDEYESDVKAMSSNADRVRHITVLGRDAVAFDAREGRLRTILWRQTIGTVVFVDLWAANDDSFDRLTQAITELSEDEWQELGRATEFRPAR